MPSSGGSVFVDLDAVLIDDEGRGAADWKARRASVRRVGQVADLPDELVAKLLDPRGSGR